MGLWLPDNPGQRLGLRAVPQRTHHWWGEEQEASFSTAKLPTIMPSSVTLLCQLLRLLSPSPLLSDPQVADHLWQSIQCYLSGGSVDVACGAVLWVAGHLTSLVPARLMSGAPPASTRVDVWEDRDFVPSLLSPWCPDRCPARTRHILRQHFQILPEGATTPVENPCSSHTFTITDVCWSPWV